MLDFGKMVHPSTAKEATVDLALRLNALVVFAAFAFIGAILLGAF
jgi:hypothetical protein